MNHKVTLTILSIFSVFSCPEINRNQTSVKKLEFLSFSPVWADVNKYMRVTGTEVFLLLLLLGNHQCTEKDEIFVLIFYPPSLQYPACEAQQFDFLAVPWLCWKFISKNEKCSHKLWNQGAVWENTRSIKTQKFSLSPEFQFDYSYFKLSYQFGYLISRFVLWFCNGTQQKGKSQHKE